ncbi:MAG: SufD family Fe-S cluster assembly protein [Clostridium sp.]|nr:SufD family Fe-S cluster assembly protein [Clostridium sp.]MCM1444581.1 SufD family Fe-S cluster assembly protein [Candidatus Amulumruptor caecigallinarius]
MNRIDIVNNDLKSINLDKKILCISSNDIVKKITIEVKEDTELYLNYSLIEDSKLEIVIILNDYVNFKLYEIKTGISSKIRTTYRLNKQSNLYVFKFNDMNSISENVIINLDGMGSKINYIFKTIGVNKEKYDLVINHNNAKTISYIKNNGVAIKNGKIIFNVSSFVYKGNKQCDVTQINRIINLTNNKCKIEPNLYIDEFDVNANHSALIGKFENKELFYLQSRGINKKDALNLLVKGFILSDLDLEDIKDLITKKIENYWR